MSQSAPGGIAELFDQQFDAVYSYVAYRLAPDREATKDVTQEVFLAAASGLAGFRGQSSLATWLRTLARRKVADHFRQAAAQDRVRQAYAQSLAGQVSDQSDETDPELATQVGQIMRRLDPEQAELLELKYLDGLSLREIAALQQNTEKAIESALTRARTSFRAIWAQANELKESLR